MRDLFDEPRFRPPIAASVNTYTNLLFEPFKCLPFQTINIATQTKGTFMKPTVLMAFSAFLCTTTSLACAGELPLKRVVLSTAGLAQFTHAGEVMPGTIVDLSVRLDQVDDLLKSLTIFDREGSIGAVSLPGKAPLAELFRDLPFGPDALTSPAALLNALTGAEVEIEGPVTAKGRVFRVEEERVQLPNSQGTVNHHRLSLMTEKGLVQAVLEDLTSVRFTEPLTKGQVERALAGLSQNRAKERRTLSITLLGQAKREAGFSYVVAAPVWKTAYRLVLPKEGDKARLQGWGIVENLTGSDWKDVELSLISGNPVALKQELYTAFYADRPEIPVTVAARVVPQKDEGGEARTVASPPVTLEGRINKALAESPKAVVANAKPILSRLSAEDAAPAEPQQQISSAAVAAESEEGATQVLYRFPTKFSLSSGSTMMVPFADREFDAQRTWLYQPDTNARRVLAAVRLKNDSESALPAGIITLFGMSGDGAVHFVGDAQLPLLPKGSNRFVVFAMDSKTDIRRTDQGTKQSKLGKLVNGVLSLTVKSRWTIEYEINSPNDEDRDIVIDEACSDGWKVNPDMKDVEETTTRVRYKVAAPKGVTTKTALKLERLDYQSVTLTSMEPAEIVTNLSGLENENTAVRDAVAKLGGIVEDINKANTRTEALETESEKIGTDQERLRQNLNTVGKGTDLGKRYLDQLKAQEDRLAAIAAEEKSLEKEIEAKRKAAEELARALTL
jgi:hypothetical protein